MITIKNNSGETLVLEQGIDISVEGCRVANEPVKPMMFKPGESITMMGYEPGISYTIRPRISPQYPRVGENQDGVLAYRAVLGKSMEQQS